MLPIVVKILFIFMLKRKIHCLHLSFITICTNIMKILFYLMTTQLYMSTK